MVHFGSGCRSGQSPNIAIELQSDITPLKFFGFAFHFDFRQTEDLVVFAKDVFDVVAGDLIDFFGQVLFPDIPIVLNFTRGELVKALVAAGNGNAKGVGGNELRGRMCGNRLAHADVVDLV